MNDMLMLLPAAAAVVLIVATYIFVKGGTDE